jgi:hypothetical protein
VVPKFCTTRKLIGATLHGRAHIEPPVASSDSNLGGFSNTYIRSRAIRERPERNTSVTLGVVGATVPDLPDSDPMS